MSHPRHPEKGNGHGRSRSSRSERFQAPRWKEAAGGDIQVSIYARLSDRFIPSGQARRLKWHHRLAIYLTIALTVGASLTTIFLYQSRSTPDLQWADPSQLPPVRRAPAMVSSEAPPDSETFIEPYITRGYPKIALKKIESILRANDRYRNIRFDGNQLQAVAMTSGLGFEDDLVFQIRTDPDRIEIYSGSRVGVKDFGANRKRLEELRTTLRELLLIK